MPFLRLLILSVLLVGPASAAPIPWAQLKVGMSADELIALLGDPLLKSRGRGFETWTYDQGAEVLVYGLVVGWTAPESNADLKRSQDVWANQPRGDYFTTLRAAVIRKPKPRPPVSLVAAEPEKPRSYAGMGYEEYLKSIYRTRQ